MIEYSVPGFKMSFPETLKRKGDFPYLTLKKIGSDVQFEVGSISIVLLSKDTDFENEYQFRFDNDTDRSPYYGVRCKNLMIVDYPKFKGAKCRFVERKEVERESIEDCSIFLNWLILIPVGNRIVEIQGWSKSCDPEEFKREMDSPEDYKEMSGLWLPVIDSLEFDPEIIDSLPDSFEAVANGNKVKYSGKGLKLSYPESLKLRGNIYDMVIKNPTTGNSLEIELIGKGRIWKRDKSDDPNMTIRSGAYQKFTGAQEFLRTLVYIAGKIVYWWKLEIPITDSRSLSVDASSVAVNSYLDTNFAY